MIFFLHTGYKVDNNITEFATEGLLHNTDVTETWKLHETLEDQHVTEHQCSADSVQNKKLPDSNEDNNQWKIRLSRQLMKKKTFCKKNSKPRKHDLKRNKILRTWGNKGGGGGKPETRLRLFPYDSVIQYRSRKGVLCLQSDMYQIRSSLNDATIIIVNNQLDAQFFFHVCLFLVSTCSEQPCAHHQEHMVLHTRRSSTQSDINQVSHCYNNSPDDGHMAARNM